MSAPQTLKLNNGHEMPIVGFGTWKLDNKKAPEIVQKAIETGYRLIDCAAIYGNEPEVGQGIKQGLESAKLKRSDIFVTSKLWATNHKPEHVKLAIKRTLKDLGLDYLDLYLIHFPIPLKHVPFEKRYVAGVEYDPATKSGVIHEKVPLGDTWKALEELVDEGLVKSIGMSNFPAIHIFNLLTMCRIQPAVLQIEIHPYLIQDEMIEYCHRLGIQVTSYSSFGPISYHQLFEKSKQVENLLEAKLIKDIASKYKVGAGQVLLRYQVQKKVAVIPKASSPERLKENFDLFSFTLEDEDMKKISDLNQNFRFNDAHEFKVPLFH